MTVIAVVPVTVAVDEVVTVAVGEVIARTTVAVVGQRQANAAIAMIFKKTPTTLLPNTPGVVVAALSITKAAVGIEVAAVVATGATKPPTSVLVWTRAATMTTKRTTTTMMVTRVMDTHHVGVVATVGAGMAAAVIEDEDSVDVAAATVVADADVLTTRVVTISHSKRLEKVEWRKLLPRVLPKVLPTTLLLLCKLVTVVASAVVDFVEDEAVVAAAPLPVAFTLRARLLPCLGCARRRAMTVEDKVVMPLQPLRGKADSPTRQEKNMCVKTRLQKRTRKTKEQKEK
jgi:hypothetical protein